MEARRIFCDTTLDHVTAIEGVCKGARVRAEVVPLPDRSCEQLWTNIENCAEMLRSIGGSPHSFESQKWEDSRVLSKTPAPGKYIQQVYIRRRILPRDDYVETLLEYISAYPIDAGWACARLASDGFGKEAEDTLNWTMKLLGFDISFAIDLVEVPMHDAYSDYYPGQTIKTAQDRLEVDKNATKCCRLTNYSSIFPGRDYPWEAFTLLPLCQPAKRREFRTNPILSHPESILTDSLPFSTTSARGGFVPYSLVPLHISNPCLRLLAICPNHVVGEPCPERKTKISSIYDQSRALFEEMRLKKHKVGPAISNAAFKDVKSEAIDHLQTVNGRVVSLTLMREITQEVHAGQVRGVIFGSDSEAGRGLAMHVDMIEKLLSAYQETRTDLTGDMRAFLGPYVDFWALILSERWSGLLLAILGQILRGFDPLSTALLNSRQIIELQYCQKDKTFIENVVSTNRIWAPDDVALVLPSAVDFGHQAYLPALRVHRQRFQYYVSSIGLRRRLKDVCREAISIVTSYIRAK